MASRDRTGLFIRYREEASSLHKRPHPKDNPAHASFHQLDDQQQLDSHNDVENPKVHIRRGGMEPDWVHSFNELKGDINEVDKMLQTLSMLYEQHLLPSFIDQDTSDLEKQIHIQSSKLTEMLYSIEQKVKSISSPPSSEQQQQQQKQKDVEQIIRKNLQKRFATPLQNLSLSFRKKQKNYIQKLKQLHESDTTSTNSNSTTATTAVTNSKDVSSSSSSASASASAPPFHQQRNQQDENNDTYDVSQTQMYEVENSSALAQQRRKELSKVAANVNDLATLVKDIAALVVDQGTVLDRVDYNLEDVRTKTTAATRELQLANRYDRKRHALCCIIILSIACGINTMILIYKWTT